ncbi:MAG: DUF2779 domain-containing protein [Lentisphaeria bacterium]|nr:DUF2779 domain-containing protein [Lentisphaeria bacterium]
MPKYLTKSRFKLAHECPTKLFYTGRKDEYADQASDDPFLEALAEGGFQVGELAKAYHPGGHDIKALGYEEALAETNALLKADDATIFEAAVRYENLFVRVDILKKQGPVLDLIEVKAKSFSDTDQFVGQRSGEITPGWEPYLMDVAFQHYVLKKAFPTAIIRPQLMLVDKNARTSVDGLNQKFKIVRCEGDRTIAEQVGDTSLEALGEPILTALNVQEYVRMLQEKTYDVNGVEYDFEEYINFLATKYAGNEKITTPVSCKKCAGCSFRANDEDVAKGLKDGFKECWQHAKGFCDGDFSCPCVMDIWNFRQKDDCLDAGEFFFQDLDMSRFDPDNETQARQCLQVEMTCACNGDPWVDGDGLKQAMSGWTWPLHFIDFETSAVAIPFSAGRHPYEMVAFQFSHHAAYEDGRIEHQDEYINTTPGQFPNFDFVRHLKAALEGDSGTVFRYAAHENTVLNHIIQQLRESSEPDRDELIEWIRTITHDSDTGWSGARDMVDMLDLVKKYYYQIDMGGSNSIKKVLPAVLNTSEYLKTKYSQPIYSSQNFKDMVWVKADEAGRVKDPYKLLPPIFSDIDQDEVEKVEGAAHLADGGAAMTAYARLQFSDVPAEEQNAVENALLRYCELDTLAMVMIWEEWRDRCS